MTAMTPESYKGNSEELMRRLYGEGKPWIFVVTAMLAAASVDDIRELVSIMLEFKRSPRKLPPPPSPKVWEKLYRSHRRLADVLWSNVLANDQHDVKDVQDDEVVGIQAMDRWRALQQMDEKDRHEAITECSSDEREALLSMLAGQPFPPDLATVKLFLDHIDVEGGDGDDPKTDFLMHSPEGQFFLRVWVPCWVLYQTYPPVLISRARRGDLNAFEDLLRLDKMALCDRVLLQRWQDEMTSGNLSRRKRLLAAMAGQPKGTLSPKKMRSYMGGLISQFALAFKCDVTEAEISELFDRIAIVRKGSRDMQLPKSPEARYKAFRRHGNWPSLPKSDK